MTVVARPLPTTQEKASAVRIQATDTHFFQAFAQAYHLARSQYRGLPLTDDIIFGSIRRVMTQPELSPHWKAGAITGWFAAIYHIPCRFDARHTPALPRPDRGIPRPIDLQYHDRDFLTAYRAGYQAFWAVVGDQPATDDGLFAELTRDYLPHIGHAHITGGPLVCRLHRRLVCGAFSCPLFCRRSILRTLVGSH